MNIVTVNPATGEQIHVYEEHPDAAIHAMLDGATRTQKEWRKTSQEERSAWLKRLAIILRKNSAHLSVLITTEMGKPLKQSEAELEKCAWLCDYYAENAARFLKGREVATDARRSYVRYDPLGVILGIMPWNFPFWQVFRFAVPTIMAGNTVVLKHASNVAGCAEWIERLFLEAGSDKGLFQNLRMNAGRVADIIADPRIRAISLTGSELAGQAVATEAAKHLKKCVLELGGSNAFVVFDDADLKKVVPLAVQARMVNTGQSCIAAKRFLVQEGIADTFVEAFTNAMSKLKTGDPIMPGSDLGPLARLDLAQQLEDQVNRALEAGADLHLGGHRTDAFFEPTVLLGVRPGNPAFEEEVFGPVASIAVFGDDREGVKMANHKRYGLGVSLCTSDRKRAERLIPRLEDGAVFINDLVKSDPRLPFGGTKMSGYGRELSKEGIREFTNIKTVYIK